MNLSETQKAYIAGFLDGDGCVMFQFIRRKDYVYGYQIRASVVFYQKDKHIACLQTIKEELGGIGYVRLRKDGMAEYTIVGISSVLVVLEQLAPYLRLKKSHVDVARKITQLLPKYSRLNKNLLLKVGDLIDQFQQLNYSKRRKNTLAVVRTFFETPRND